MAFSKGEHLKVREGDLIDMRFKVVHEVGCGNFSKVYSCYDVTRTRYERRELVAVKIIKREYREDAHFEKEILEILRSKGGKSVCRMIEFFEWRRCPVFVMSIHGPSLRSRRLGYNGGVITRTKLVQLAHSLLKTFCFIHFDCRMVHTDIKPENILIADVDTPKHSIGNNWVVCDFGSASLWRIGHLDADLISTRPYRAPEVILGNPWFYPADIWSIGCILYELATGHRLFEVRDDIMHLHLMDKRLGPLPEVFTKRSKNSAKFFTPQGRFLQECDLTRTGKVCMKKISEALPNDDDLCDLITSMLIYDPYGRINAKEALNHRVFNSIDWESENVGGAAKLMDIDMGVTGGSIPLNQLEGGDLVEVHRIRPEEEAKPEVDCKSLFYGGSVLVACDGDGDAGDAQVAEHDAIRTLAEGPQITLSVAVLPLSPPPTTITIQQIEEVVEEDQEVVESAVADTLIPSRKKGREPSIVTAQGYDVCDSPHRSDRFRKMRGLPILHLPESRQNSFIAKQTSEVSVLELSLLQIARPAQQYVTDESGSKSNTSTKGNAYSPSVTRWEHKGSLRAQIHDLVETVETAIHPTIECEENISTNEGAASCTGTDEIPMGLHVLPYREETVTTVFALPAVQKRPSDNAGALNESSRIQPLRGIYDPIPVNTSTAAAPKRRDSLPAALCPTNVQYHAAKSTSSSLFSWSESSVQEHISPMHVAPLLSIIATERERVPVIITSCFCEESASSTITQSRSTSVAASLTSVNGGAGDSVQESTSRASGPYPPPILAFRKAVQELRPGLVTSVVNMPRASAPRVTPTRAADAGSQQCRVAQMVAPNAPPVARNGYPRRPRSCSTPFYRRILPQGDLSTVFNATVAPSSRTRIPQVPSTIAGRFPTTPAPSDPQVSVFAKSRTVGGGRAPQTQSFRLTRASKRGVIQRCALPNDGVATRVKKVDPKERLAKAISSYTLHRVVPIEVSGGGRGGVDICDTFSSNNGVPSWKNSDTSYRGEGACDDGESGSKSRGSCNVRRLLRVRAPE